MRISDWSSDVCSSDLRYANACGAIVVSRHGCSPAMPTWEELQVFLASDERPFRLRDDAALEQLHWATPRAGSWDELMVLAMDHRSQFEALCAQAGAAPVRIAPCKALALRGSGRAWSRE